MADDFVPILMQLLERVRKNFSDPPIGIDGALDAVSIQRIQDSPDAGFAAIFAIGERRIIRFVAAAPIL
jgi:hypothetical protein